MDRECTSSAARYGMVLDATLITGIDPPPEVESALAAINTAQQLATEMGDEFVSTEHLLLALDVVPRDELRELFPSADAGQRNLYDIVTGQWANRWPSEDAWVAHRR